MPHAVERGLELGCEAIQVFTRNQRQWTPKPLAQDEIDAFRAGARGASYATRTVSHASYLINLCATDAAILKKSKRAFVDEIERCAALGIPFLCVHPGSHVGAGEEAGLRAIAASIKEALKATRGKRVTILLENTAGQGTNLGWRLEHLGELLRTIRSKRVGVCIDTCHLFAAGYDLRTPKAYDKTIDALDEAVGLDRIRAWHLNDSKHPLGSRRDRHENIGEGALGRAAFRRLVNDERFADAPALLETPGGPDGYRKDLKRLKGMRK
jgi:deoxyribonuclease-4